MRITGRQLRQIIKEELDGKVTKDEIGQAFWPGAGEDLEAIRYARIPVFTDGMPGDQLAGISIALEQVLLPAVGAWSDLGPLKGLITGSYDKVAEMLGGSTAAAFNLQIMGARVGLGLPAVGGWDDALKGHFEDLLKKSVAAGGVKGSKKYNAMTRVYAPDSPAQAQTK
jgi:hypothetical protein